MPFRPFAWVRCVCECELCESILFEIMICFFLVYFFFRGDENLHNLCDLKKFDQLSTGLRADWHVCPHIYMCVRARTHAHTLPSMIIIHTWIKQITFCAYLMQTAFFPSNFLSRISICSPKMRTNRNRNSRFLRKCVIAKVWNIRNCEI